MTAREKAIEAAARLLWNHRHQFDSSHKARGWETVTEAVEAGELTGYADGVARQRWEVEAVLGVAAPLIESALLDRIEEKVTGLRSEVSFADNFGAGYNRALDSVLAALTEIREGEQ